MESSKIIGGPFSEEVINQLAIRSKVFSNNTRTDENLQYLNARTGWVKLTSGVNVGDTDTLAKKYILIAGTQGRYGDKTYSNFTGEEGKGFRPMPGITGVQIRSINRFGVLKEATITFNCWDVSQLQELELLYMRPGFTALLEWGHSLYYKSENDFVKTPSTVQTFFNSGASKEAIYAEIEKLKQSSGYNYDGILGFVKNFSWSYRADGGYDCTTSLVSIGEIMESLTVDLDVAAVTVDNSPPVAETETKPPTMLENIFLLTKKFGVGGAWNKIKSDYPDFATKFAAVNGYEKISPAKKSGVQVKDTVETTAGTPSDFMYITLKDFCAIVNTVLLWDNNNKNLIRLNTKIAPLSGQANPDKIPWCRLRNFKFQTSSDPAICLLITPSADAWFPGGSANSFLTGLRRVKEGSSDEILNIWLNVDFLAQLVTDLRAQDKDQRTLNNLFEPLFSQLNQVLGNVTDINFYYDESIFTYYIVDRAVRTNKEEVSVLNVTGLKSSVTQFNFVTKLSPAITTMCAISAQAGAADVGLEAEALLRWNEGLTDRIIKSKSQKDKNTDDEATVRKQRADDQLKRTKDLVKIFNEFWTGNTYNKEKFDTARIAYEQYATTYVQLYDEEGVSDGNAGPAGIIPFEVNIQMDGISGIKIGQAFKINESIMPNKYNGVVGFIVTGIDHDIQGNRWHTNLKAQTIVLRNKVKGSGPAQANSGQNPDGTSNTEVSGIVPSKVSVSKTIKDVYIPALEKTVPNGSKGIKLLITAQTQMEGFKPGTKSYRTNNPGNIGNTDNGGVHRFDTLEKGIKGQYDYAVKVALNKNKNYKLNARKQAPAIYDRDSGQNYPGIDFIFNGSLDQYLKIYSTGARKYNTYLNLVVGYFKKNGIAITGSTTLKQIYDIT